MKKTGLFFLSILLVGVFLFREGNFSDSNPSLTISQNKFLLSNPSWFLTNKNSNFTYKLISNQASQNDSDEAFLIKEPMLEAISNDKIKSSISSEEARLELYNEKLIMKTKVHFRLINDKEITHLYTEQINLDLKNNTASTGLDVELKSEYFVLRGNGFQLIESPKGETQITFAKADLKQNLENGYQKLGSADSVLFNEESAILIFRGSAEIKLELMNMTADEIEYNYKTRSILSSKNSVLINKT